MSAKEANQTVSDDQELAKVLANNTNQQKNDAAAAADEALSGLQFEESPVPSQGGGQGAQTAPSTSSGQGAPAQKPNASTTPSITPSPSATAAAESKSQTQAQTSTTTPSTSSTAPAPSSAASATSAPSITPGTSQGGSLDNIKKDALEELRPLVDKLDLPAEEKFDTLLLIIRSTDDKSLLTPAHEAAKAITDESRRAQALLDIIKEIDYFAGQQA